MESSEAIILTVMNTILAIAQRGLKNSGLQQGFNLMMLGCPFSLPVAFNITHTEIFTVYTLNNKVYNVCINPKKPC